MTPNEPPEKSYEVELKFRIDDPRSVKSHLKNMGATEQKLVHHVDRYFNHPCRDFRVTDEAFRVRSVDENNCVTYKGAVIGTVAKTRHEIEVSIAKGPEAVRQIVEMMTMLGFRFVREVRKSRRSFSLNWNDNEIEVTIDEVPELGFFLEIELIAKNQAREAAEATIWELARLLGMSNAEPRSYLSMLLQWDDQRRQDQTPASRS